MELTVAVAIIAAVFAAIMPLFAGVRNSADSRWANLEMVQSARVLNEQLCRHLAAAKRITAASADTSNDGYIQFEAADGVSYRCALGAGSDVEFGPVGDLNALVGPVDYLRFICYDGNDLVNSTPTPEGARLVTWEAGLRSAGPMTRDKIIRGACYLRVAVGGQTDEEVTTALYDFAMCTPGVDCFAFAGQERRQVPDLPSTPAQPLESAQYAAISADDGTFHVLQVSSDTEYAQIRLTFEIEPEPGDVAAITATWKGRCVNTHAAATDGATLYLWDYGSSRYEMIQTSQNTEAEITLAGSAAGPAARYVGGAGGRTVMLLVVSTDKKRNKKENTLSTDYAKIDITISEQTGAFTP